MHPGQRQRRTDEDEIPHLAAPQREVFDTVGKPLPTSSATGASLKELMARLGHSSTRAALIYQHATRDRDQAIAKALGGLVQQVRLSSADEASKEA